MNTALSWSFPGSALDVSLSRRWLAAAVEQAWGAGDDADRVVLAYSEVATNAVVHGTGPVTVRTRIQEALVTCEVADCSAHAPQPRRAAAEDVRGRGLDLVELTVDRFRVDLREAGKTVSFEVGRRRGAPAESGRSPLSRSGPGPAGPWSGSETDSENEPNKPENKQENKFGTVSEDVSTPTPTPEHVSEHPPRSALNGSGGSGDPTEPPKKHQSPAPERDPEPGRPKTGSAGEAGGGSTGGGLGV